jgi:hypothetical protein
VSNTDLVTLGSQVQLITKYQHYHRHPSLLYSGVSGKNKNALFTWPQPSIFHATQMDIHFTEKAIKKVFT